MIDRRVQRAMHEAVWVVATRIAAWLVLCALIAAALYFGS